MTETTAAHPPADHPQITTETVQHLASLARIALSEAETASLTTELGSILRTIEKVSEVAAPDVAATSHPIPLNNVTRPDVIADVLTPEEALQNAPAAQAGMFQVSSILGEEQ